MHVLRSTKHRWHRKLYLKEYRCSRRDQDFRIIPIEGEYQSVSDDRSHGAVSAAVEIHILMVVCHAYSAGAHIQQIVSFLKHMQILAVCICSCRIQDGLIDVETFNTWIPSSRHHYSRDHNTRQTSR